MSTHELTRPNLVKEMCYEFLRHKKCRPFFYIFSPSFYLFPRALSSSELIHPLQTEASMSSRSGRLRSGSLPTLPTRLLFPSEPSTTNSNSIRWERMWGKIESDGLQWQRGVSDSTDARTRYFVLSGFPQVHCNQYVHIFSENKSGLFRTDCQIYFMLCNS